MAPLRRLYDHQGGVVELGSELRRGGEGVVFDLAASPAHVAKVYHQHPIPTEKASKLAWMAATQTAELSKIAAWPTATLHERPGGNMCGFVMPRIVGFKEVHLLYGPQSRRREFPEADWRFLLHVAMNCAAAFDAVHERGNVVADVNAGNLLVSPKDATVRLIDCDSFQVRVNGKPLLCEVGVPEYTPPELQGKPFKGVERTENHDRFGLAVLIFHLVFMGRHPFFGRFLGAGDMPLERAIRECRFAFGQAAALKQMAPPPHSISLSSLPGDVASLFEQAFGERSAVSGRPTARDWHQTLSSLLRQFLKCQNDTSHWYPSTMPACPWCTIVAAGGPAFFVSFQVGLVDFVWNAADLDPIVAQLRQIVSGLSVAPITSAGTSLAIPSALPASAIAAKSKLAIAKWLGAGGAGGALVGLLFLLALSSTIAGAVLLMGLLVVAAGGAWAFWLGRFSAFGVEKMRRRRAFSEAWQRALESEAEWQRSTGGAQAAFQRTQDQIETVRREYAGLRGAFESDSRKQGQDKAEAQRRAYLQNQLIEDAQIKGVGTGRKRQLLNYNIETAFDILHGDLDAVPGFGPALRQSLAAWARSVDVVFRFDATKDVPEADRRSLVIKYRQRQMQLKGQLEKTVIDLRGFRGQVESRQHDARQRMLAAKAESEKARADLLVL